MYLPIKLLFSQERLVNSAERKISAERGLSPMELHADLNCRFVESGKEKSSNVLPSPLPRILTSFFDPCVCTLMNDRLIYRFLPLLLYNRPLLPFFHCDSIPRLDIAREIRFLTAGLVHWVITGDLSNRREKEYFGSRRAISGWKIRERLGGERGKISIDENWMER